ncbi:ankyrin repeat domain-containing protein [Desulfotomaculum nigrificans]|uniref:ankyrin repeat domain-containing protein n=1 Tax=Desulfotomaculum nigrificans TaxID=1565 RepID=UPI003BEECC9F
MLQKMAIEVVKTLLNKGSNPNAKDNNNKTALIYASANGHSKIVEMLLNYEADKSIISKEGLTALEYALKK